MNTFIKKGFTPSSQYEDEQPKGFIRSKQDNKILVPMQVKNFFDVVDRDATLWIDADGIPYKCASSVEENYISVSLSNKEEGVEDKLTLNTKKEFKNRTEFKGKTKGENIGSGSFLYDLNLSREVNGLAPLELKDFNIEDGKRLKYEKGVTVDNIKFNNSFEVCKHFIDKWIEECGIQTQLKKIKCVLGSGDTHRHSVLVPHQYKSDRSKSRPILLTEARKYVESKYDTFMAPPLMEADEVVDAMAARAYDVAKKTKTKVKVVKAANDKDARSKRGITFDWAKSFHFNNPQCWEIKDFKDDVGLIELHKGEIKGGGAVHFAYQILMSDEADEYSPRKYLPEDFVHYGTGYGVESFYKDFAPLKTSKGVFQKVVDKYLEWFPFGLQYRAWDGTVVDEDTLSYLQKHYQLAYMLESKDDKSTVMDLLDGLGVNYEGLKDNNHYTPPKRVFVGNEESVENVVSLVQEILKEDFKSIKTLKKADLSPRLDLIKEKLQTLLDVESHYEMQQELKPKFANKIDKENK
ncbi:hypothetical protein NVP1084O_055 [Vibrio phage 1.084.O._10N.261.49.F5]|nr:hypothetical protein NVP1084O_055 [Vibrio phage 1.084.O._10N.261.49.F5]